MILTIHLFQLKIKRIIVFIIFSSILQNCTKNYWILDVVLSNYFEIVCLFVLDIKHILQLSSLIFF